MLRGLDRLQTYLAYLVVLFVPFAGYRILTPIASLSITNVLIITSILLISIGVCINRHDITLSKTQIHIILLLTVAVLFGSVSSTLTGGDPRELVTLFGYVLLVAILSVSIRDRSELQTLLHFVFIGAVTISIVAIISSVFHLDLVGYKRTFHHARSIFGFQIPFTRTAGVPLSHGEFGMYTVGILPLYLTTSIRDRNLPKLVGCGIIIFTVLFILQSRSTWLGLFASLSCVFFLHPLRWWLSGRSEAIYRRIRHLGYILVPVGFLVLVYAIVSIGQSIGPRLSHLLTSLEVIPKRPLFGYGDENLRVFFRRNQLPHNAFLRYWVAMGTLTIAPLIAIFGIQTRELIRTLANSSRQTYFLTAGFLGGFLAVFIEVNLLVGFGKTAWMWIAIYAVHCRVNGPWNEEPV